jgi:hypothetical protein
MAVNIATRASDLRRSKWGSFRDQPGESLMEVLQREADNRPQPRFQDEQMVLTPIGMRRVASKFHSYNYGWQYRFWTPNGNYIFKEKQIMSQGEGLLLTDIMNTIAARG